MILSNVEILKAIKAGTLKIGDLRGNENPHEDPFNTTSVDLHLGTELRRLKGQQPVAFDLTKTAKIGDFLEKNTESEHLSPDRPFNLRPLDFVLANTKEYIELPIGPVNSRKKIYGARVEGKSSIARCGILIHFTAPTIHPGFGKPRLGSPITLEICNLGKWDFMLYPNMAICQLIIEVVHGKTALTENQFTGQVSPTGASR